jgi:hypothetical protein
MPGARSSKECTSGTCQAGGLAGSSSRQAVLRVLAARAADQGTGPGSLVHGPRSVQAHRARRSVTLAISACSSNRPVAWPPAGTPAMPATGRARHATVTVGQENSTDIEIYTRTTGREGVESALGEGSAAVPRGSLRAARDRRGGTGGPADEGHHQAAQPGEIAIIDHADLYRISAEELTRRKRRPWSTRR